jgi:sugar lactone lactonase YvrE
LRRTCADSKLPEAARDRKEKKMNAPGILGGVVLASLLAFDVRASDDVAIIARGASLHSANGFTFDANDLLYAASGPGSQLVVMDKQGKILDRFGSADGAQGLDDVAVAPDGNVYWTEPFSGQVKKLATSGAIVSVAQLPPGANGITISPGGRIYVNTTVLSDTLWEVYPDGSAPRLIAQGLGFPNAMDVGPDGFIYVPSWIVHKTVLRVNPETGETTTAAAGFQAPLSVRFDPQGRMHVLDQIAHGIVRVDLTTGAKTLVTEIPPNSDNFDFDSAGRLYVSSAEDGAVRLVKNDGQLKEISPSGMILPGGLAVREGPDGKDELFVSDMFTLRKFEVAGQAKPREVEHIRFMDPTSMITVQSVSNAANGTDLILTTWFFGGAVQIWNPVTQTAVATHRDLAFPLNAIAFDGDVAVAELATGKVIRLSDRSTLGSGFTVPTGLAAIGGDLYVADFATGVVSKIVDDGTPLPSPVAVATGLAAPEGLTVDTDGGLLVAETGIGRVSKIDVATGTVTAVASNLAFGNNPAIPFVGPPTSPTWLSFTTVVVSPTSNDLYVAGDNADVSPHDRASVIYRIER